MKEKDDKSIKYIYDIKISKHDAREIVLHYNDLFSALDEALKYYDYYEIIMEMLPALTIALYKAYYADMERDNARERAKLMAGNMTQAQRSERARKAAAKRWHKDPDTLSLNTAQNLKLENAINKKLNKQKQAK